MGCAINAAVAIPSICVVAAAADDVGDGVRNITGGALLIYQLGEYQTAFKSCLF